MSAQMTHVLPFPPPEHPGAGRAAPGTGAQRYEGYWSPKGQEPAEPPSYEPPGAILVPEGARLEGSFEALDLVKIEGEWRVLSHAAVLTYFHSAGIVEGEAWSFTVFEPGGVRHVFVVEDRPERLGPADIAPRFGEKAHDIARPDRHSVLLRLRRDA